MDWIILVWTLFVLIVYVGGYLFPAFIGIYTWNLGAVYAVFLIGAAASSALRLVANRSGATPEGRHDSRQAPKTKK